MRTAGHLFRLLFIYLRFENPTHTIPRRTLKKAPYFFDRNSMKFFGQRMSDYKVKRSPKGKIFIFAPTYDARGNKMPYTFREFKNDDLISQSGMFESDSEILKYISKR